MVVNVTPFAKSKMIELLKNHNMKNLFFSVKGGGCNGFSYAFLPILHSDSKTDEEVKLDSEHSMFVCGKSIIHVLGVEIDYENNIMTNGFIFKNPNTSGKCGCGQSFN